MTSIVKGRVLDYSGAPIASTLVFVPEAMPTAASSRTVLAKPVTVRADRRGEYSLRLAAGSYTVTLAPMGVTAAVNLNSGEEYGLATLLGLSEGDSYSVVVSDDGTTMTVPASYLVDESGEQYTLGGVTAYTVAGTDAQIEEAIGTKVEDIAAAKIEELVAAEVEESAAPLIEAAVTEEVAPLRTAVTAVESDVTELAGAHASDVAALEAADKALASRVDGVGEDVTALEGDIADLTDTDESLASRVAALEAGGGSGGDSYDDSALVARVEAAEGEIDVLQSDTATLTTRVSSLSDDVDVIGDTADTNSRLVAALNATTTDHETRLAAVEAREDQDTIYDDTEIVGRVTSVEATVADHGTRLTAAESTVASNTSRVSLLEQQMDSVVLEMLTLGTDEEIPEGTPAGTLVVRRAD